MSTSDSAVVAGTLTLRGVWLADPTDPAGTSLNLPFGRAARNGVLAVEATDQVFAGREYPIAFFGPHTSNDVQVRADVPHGPTWYATLAALDALILRRIPLSFRDNRGRNFPAARLSSVAQQDTPFGTQVTFTVGRADVEA